MGIISVERSEPKPALYCRKPEKIVAPLNHLLPVKGLSVGRNHSDGIGIAFRLSGMETTMQTRMTRFWDSVAKATVLGLLLGCLLPEK
jgi:hypothetical protein